MNNNSEYQIFIFVSSTMIHKRSIIYIWVLQRAHVLLFYCEVCCEWARKYSTLIPLIMLITKKHWSLYNHLLHLFWLISEKVWIEPGKNVITLQKCLEHIESCSAYSSMCCTFAHWLNILPSHTVTAVSYSSGRKKTVSKTCSNSKLEYFEAEQIISCQCQALEITFVRSW